MTRFKKIIDSKEKEKKRLKVLVGIRNVDILSGEEKVKEALSDSLKGSVYVTRVTAQSKPEGTYCIGPWVRIFSLTNPDDFDSFKEKMLEIDGVNDVKKYGNAWKYAIIEAAVAERAEKFQEYYRIYLDEEKEDYDKYGSSNCSYPYNRDQIKDFLETVNVAEGEIRILFGDNSGFKGYFSEKQVFTLFIGALVFLEEKTKEVLLNREDMEIEVPNEVLKASRVQYFEKNGKKKIQFHVVPGRQFVDINLFLREV